MPAAALNQPQNQSIGYRYVCLQPSYDTEEDHSPHYSPQHLVIEVTPDTVDIIEVLMMSMLDS